jgi:hypothetical protein
VYELYSMGNRTGPCGIPACIYFSTDLSPSTETLNFRCDRNELISLITRVENCSTGNLQSKSWCHVVSQPFFDIEGYRKRR